MVVTFYHHTYNVIVIINNIKGINIIKYIRVIFFSIKNARSPCQWRFPRVYTFLIILHFVAIILHFVAMLKKLNWNKKYHTLWQNAALHNLHFFTHFVAKCCTSLLSFFGCFFTMRKLIYITFKVFPFRHIIFIFSIWNDNIRINFFKSCFRM